MEPTVENFEENVQPSQGIMQSQSLVMQLETAAMQPEVLAAQPQQTMVLQSQPVVMQSQPVIVQSQSVIMQSQPMIPQSQPVIAQSQPVVMPPQPVVTPSQPVVMPSQPVGSSSGPYTKLHQWDERPSAVFICRLCKKTFYNATALQNHKNAQHDGEASCSENEYTPTFYDDQDWYNYIGRGSFKFIPCETDCSSSDTVTDGLTTRVYSEDTTYIIIKMEGDDEDSKSQDLKKVSPVDLRGPFTCTFPTPLGPELQCRQIFFNCCDYSLHYREEHTKRRKAALRCQVCEKRLDRDFNPTVSLATQLLATNQITFSCRMCGKTFLDGSHYDEHNRSVHAKMKPHQCPLCKKRFTQQGGLQQHLRMHSGIRPFACTFCPKAFTQKAGLDQHLRTHTKVKPFICVVCGKSFSQSVHLRQHMRTHTNIQPFECSVCRRRFKQSSHLNFHMRCHVSDGTLPMESYARVIEQQNHLDFLNLANLQPVQDGETLYYAAEIAPSMHTNPNAFGY